MDALLATGTQVAPCFASKRHNGWVVVRIWEHDDVNAAAEVVVGELGRRGI
jgi:hypothetical protein